jgi:hypothetical protein
MVEQENFNLLAVGSNPTDLKGRAVFVVQGLEHNLFTVETWIRFPSEISELKRVTISRPSKKRKKNEGTASISFGRSEPVAENGIDSGKENNNRGSKRVSWV